MHDYHFKLNEESRAKLLKISEDMDLSVSATIVALFEKFMVFVEKNHLKAEEKNSIYRIIADPEEKRYSVHSYMPEKLYRKMKQLHLDLNYYSIAQVLRKMIELFILGCLKYGVNKFISMLDKFNAIWSDKKEIFKKAKMIFIRQLSMKILNKPELLVKYDILSQPISIQYL
jgi:hypothetical protein